MSSGNMFLGDTMLKTKNYKHSDKHSDYDKQGENKLINDSFFSVLLLFEENSQDRFLIPATHLATTPLQP